MIENCPASSKAYANDGRTMKDGVMERELDV
jgi:hypothetical protein